jgi:hypothetical protein
MSLAQWSGQTIGSLVIGAGCASSRLAGRVYSGNATSLLADSVSRGAVESMQIALGTLSLAHAMAAARYRAAADSG